MNLRVPAALGTFEPSDVDVKLSVGRFSGFGRRPLHLLPGREETICGTNDPL